MQELLENIRKGKAEPDVELLLAKVDDIVRLLLIRGGFSVCQKNRNVVRDAEVLLELPFKKKLGWALCPSMSGAYTIPATFLALTNRLVEAMSPPTDILKHMAT